MTAIVGQAAERGLLAVKRVGNQASALLVARFLLVTLAGVLIAVSGNLPRLTPALLAMVLLQVIMSVPIRTVRRPIASVVEGAAVMAISAVPEPASGNLMVCLLAPALSAGLRGGYRWVGFTGAAGAIVGVALILRTPSDFDTQSLIDLFQWTSLALVLGLTAAWYVTQQRERDSDEGFYVDAVRVLTDLSAISRKLPAGLDVQTIANRTLADAAQAAHATRGVLLTLGSRDGYETAATYPDGSTDWLGRVGAVADWRKLAEAGQAVRRRSSDGVISMNPVMVGDTLIALTLLQSPRQPAPYEDRELVRVVANGAVPLQAAVLFSDVRDFATSEERSRIAREIHDGIAQDVAFLGYAADNLIEETSDATTRELAVALRRDITRIVGDLRMSVFSLREGVSPSESLGASVGNHARRVFEGSTIDVHVTINESPHRLRRDVESELLRMTQEALTNARRHSEASNVWVTCTVDAPTAAIRVQDDGRGMGESRADSFGLAIMEERAARVSADLRIYQPPSGGRVVDIVV